MKGAGNDHDEEEEEKHQTAMVFGQIPSGERRQSEHLPEKPSAYQFIEWNRG